MATLGKSPKAQTGEKKPVSRARQLERLKKVCERGVQSCRQGNWKEGLTDLRWLENGKIIRGIPSTYYAYLGYGLARHRNKVSEGVRLCRLAVRMEFYQTENYVLLAGACMASPDYRRVAVEAVRSGLEIDPDSKDLLELHHQLGIRRPPVLSFLARENAINRLLGSLRHVLGRTPEPPKRSAEKSGLVMSAAR